MNSFGKAENAESSTVPFTVVLVKSRDTDGNPLVPAMSFGQRAKTNMKTEAHKVECREWERIGI